MSTSPREKVDRLKDFSDPPVKLDVRSMSATDIDTLALKLIEDQKSSVGATYVYCACGAAVSKHAARNAKLRGRDPRCRSCYKLSQRKIDANIYLCSVCRQPILDVGRRKKARYNAKLARGFTCGEKSCTSEAIGRAARRPLPCRVCGSAVVGVKASRARYKGHNAYCSESCFNVGRRGRLPSGHCKCGRSVSGSNRTSDGGCRSCRNAWRRSHYPKAAKAVMCAECGVPVVWSTAAKARKTGAKVFCGKHRGRGVSASIAKRCRREGR